MPGIRVKENEHIEAAMRRFKRICEKAGVISEMRRHEFYEKPKWIRKRKLAQAKKRLQKKLSREVPPPIRGSKAGTKKKKSRIKTRKAD
ncbi:MAG: 30S ribosomal protein S21 [Gammaproteobacteria bacterium]|nr:30S ribosomal protein S21 [Gammaproteobacteria bacterium]MBU1558322.1 30S ribosomal protein S21 [Gammaproteobacteria bacterium]MBU1628719.1 30S ribosomal protein S21 [Gammaproteobacteria bacterium]MBU1926761.1 30S ribosomal protein S21 [Gammaproteobacteria bacterium]MBU2546261.1 30S ribosomal protein S21 [Gammaproteobacteria bacterium]